MPVRFHSSTLDKPDFFPVFVGRKSNGRYKSATLHLLNGGKDDHADCVNVHALADLRNVSQNEEANITFLGAEFLCFGADRLCKRYKQEKAFESTGLNNNASASTSFFTTALDFPRCYLANAMAGVSRDEFILDPFAGSCSLLRVAEGFGAITFSSDVEPKCCIDGHNHAHVLPHAFGVMMSSVEYGVTGASLVADIAQCPWRGPFDAIVCDPPYHMRTSHLLRFVGT